LPVLTHLHAKGRMKGTLASISDRLKHLARNTDLNNPVNVETFIANKVRASNRYKQKLCIAYNHYCQYYKIQWEMPHYQPQPRVQRLPTEEQINKLIAAAGKILSLKLWLSKETGMRPIEIHALRVKDLDTERNIVNPLAVKDGAPRPLKITEQLKKALFTFIIQNNRNANDTIFRSNARKYGNDFRGMRNRLAKRTQDPQLATVRLYDFRHFHGTMTYHKYKDIVITAAEMGHRNIATTMIYVHLDRLIELAEQDGFICKTATNIEDAKRLIEANFEYVTEMDGIKLFRKRK
jgi:integrase